MTALIKPTGPLVHITRAGEGTELRLPGSPSFRVVGNHGVSGAYTAIILSPSNQAEQYRHYGKRFALVLTGSIRIVRERRGGRYEAYVPDGLSGWVPRLSVDVIATASRAESAVQALNRRAAGAGPHPLDAFAHVLSRVEAVASSRIEGIELSPRRLLTAEAERQADGRLTGPRPRCWATSKRLKKRSVWPPAAAHYAQPTCWRSTAGSCRHRPTLT